MTEINVARRDDEVAARSSSNPAYQAFQILHIAFVIVPLVAGLDKFVELLVDWERYLWPVIPNLVGLAPETFMRIVGAIEIVAALLLAFRPRVGGYVVCAWLIGIIINLLLLGNYYDVALRDLGLALGAFSLARLATVFAAHRAAGAGRSTVR